MNNISLFIDIYASDENNLAYNSIEFSFKSYCSYSTSKIAVLTGETAVPNR